MSEIQYGSGIVYTNGVPDHNPGEFGAKLAVNEATKKLYVHDTGTNWTEYSAGGEAQEPVTYAQIISKIGASELVPGLRYQITDFRSAWYHTDGGVTINNPGAGALFGPQYGSIEPLIVTALDVNKLSSQAFSTVFPADIISYDWNQANWTSDAFCADGGTIISGWRGVITERIDPIRGLKHTCDWRNMKFLRWAVTAPAYNAGNTYNLGDAVRFNNNIYCCKRNGTVGISPTNSANWIEALSQINSGNNARLSVSSSGISISIPDIDAQDSGQFLVPVTGAPVAYKAFPTQSANSEISGQAGYRAANIVVHSACSSSVLLCANSTFASVTRCQIGLECQRLFGSDITDSNINPSSFDCIFARSQGAHNAYFNSTIVGLGCAQLTGSFTTSFVGSGSVSSDIKGAIFSDIGSITNSQIGFEFTYNRIGTAQEIRFANGCQNNTFNGVIVRSEFLDGYSFNTHLGDTRNCKIGRDSTGNTWPEMTGVTLGDSAQNNAQASTSGPWNFVEAGGGFQGNDLGALTRCRFGDLFSLNVGDFEDCNLDSNFGRNIFNGQVKKLNGGAGFQNGDYTQGASIVYNNATKTFLLNANEDKKIQYVNSSNAIIITAHDA